MKKQIKIIFILIMIFNIQIHCVSAPRNLIILLDDNIETPYTEQFGIMDALIPALIQKAAPIIVSPSLWNNFIVRKKRFEDSPDKNKLQTNLVETLQSIAAGSRTVKLNLICYATPFDPKEWVIKKIPNIAYILIPTKYLKNIENSTPKAFKNDIPMLDQQKTLFKCYKANNFIDGNLTLRELLLGLKIDHCENVPNPLAPVNNQEMNNQTIELENFDWTQLFVTRKDLGLQSPTPSGTKKSLPPMSKAQSEERWKRMTKEEKANRIELTAQEKNIIQDYTQYRKKLLDTYKKTQNNLNAKLDVFEQYMFPWFIYLTGHGSPDEWGTIASFTVNNFLEFIKFLNFSINTKLFFYDSCFVGGQHTDPTFQYSYIHTKNTFKKVPFNLNFTVVAGALTDKSTQVAMPSVFHPVYKQPGDWDIIVDTIPLAISLEINYQQFFDELEKYFTYSADKTELNKKTLPDITNMVHKFKSFGVVDSTRINNIPLIRLPNTEWFKALDLDKDVNIINKKTITQYLQTPKSFDVDKNVLLIYEPYIPMKIIFKTESTVIPMNTSQNDYYFENIENTIIFSPTLFEWFKPLVRAQYSSNYYIKTYEITLSNNGVYPGELGKPAYTNKKVILTDVIYTISRGVVSSRFTFIANKKPYYYEILPNGSFGLITKAQEIQQYITQFDTKVKTLTKQYEEFKQKTQTISENIQQKIKSPDVQPRIDERKLVNALNNLTESLNQLKTRF